MLKSYPDSSPFYYCHVQASNDNGSKRKPEFLTLFVSSYITEFLILLYHLQALHDNGSKPKPEFLNLL